MKSLRTLAALTAATLAISVGSATSFAQMADDTMPATPEATEMPAGVEADATQAAPNQSAFGVAEADQSLYLLSSNPTSRLGGRQSYGLMVLEQKGTGVTCFETVGSSPTVVIPPSQAAATSGKCGRSTDTNGYILRAADGHISYDPVIEEKDGVLALYARPRLGRQGASLLIGQTDGIAPSGYTKIFLNSNWRIARQTLNATGATTGRTYITSDMTLAQLVDQAGGEEIIAGPGPGTSPTLPTNPTTPAPQANFPDIAGDTYLSEINRAVQLGFISGFAEDNTFRPRAALTREQLVSIVIDGLGISDLPTVTTPSYSDVTASRWSTPKIERADQLGIIEGYTDGTFRPTQNVTRAELIAIMRRAAEYKNNTTQLVSNQNGQTFADTQGHWAQDTIASLSEYCGIATSLNETGNNFAPQTAAQRNYAAAAMVRLLDCSQTTTADNQ